MVDVAGLRIGVHSVGHAESHADSYLIVEGLTRQRQYLLMYRAAVGRLAAGAPSLTETQKQELTQVMTAFLRGAPLGWLASLGADADAVAAELAA
jgi:hypothetical protein